MTLRYADAFLNALMDSHQITIRGELWFNNAYVGTLGIAGGSVNGDRAGSVRRTAQITLDPTSRKDPVLGPRLNPYGSRVKLWRGIRYPSGAVDEVQVFYGRIDAIEAGYDGVNLTCSDLAADVMGAKLVKVTGPAGLPGAPSTFLNTIKALITEAIPGMTYNTHGIPDVTLTGSVTQWSQERGDALDQLCTQLPTGKAGVTGCEWYIDMLGAAHVAPLPAVVTSGTPGVWIIDSGDVGVIVDRAATMDRQNVYNAVIVDGEAVGGTTPAHGEWYNSTGDMAWGGPFGKVVNYYSGQQLNPNTTAGAVALAQQLGLNSLSTVKALSVTCVPNPKLQLGDVVQVFTADNDLDGMYYVQSFTLPMDPETAMTLTLCQSLQIGAAGMWEPADLRIPKGAVWQPIR